MASGSAETVAGWQKTVYAPTWRQTHPRPDAVPLGHKGNSPIYGATLVMPADTATSVDPLTETNCCTVQVEAVVPMVKPPCTAAGQVQV